MISVTKPDRDWGVRANDRKMIVRSEREISRPNENFKREIEDRQIFDRDIEELRSFGDKMKL